MPIAERSRPEHEAVAGLFMNLIVLRTDLSNDPTFVELLDRVRQTFIDAYKHRELPFGLVSGPGVDPGAFRVVFNFFVARRAAATLPGLTVRSIDMNDESPSYAELGLHLFDTGDAVHGFVAYDTARFSRERIAAIAGQFNELLSAVLAAPEQRISNYADLAGATAGESAA
jgi:non-ribosomal peptide synthetase component F